MAPALFISDLHLAPERPELVAAFHAFVSGRARGATALYVLGDLFDVWLGDDQLREPLAAGVAAALRALSASGTPVYLQRGNRDFLLGERFARAAGATLLPDAIVHDLHGKPTLIMHGDQLCTDDVDYQRLRAFWQNPANRRRVSRLPYAVRRAIARLLRAGSRRLTSSKPEEIMDVNAGAVAAAMSEHHVARLIHGHTHRPARHELSIDGRTCERYVLADWYKAGSYLEVG
ncbi:MAG TPA: UDP-2,3-diacylglucosamine diphosphatase, partial [Pseudomonadota bacterium]|nr:UDP-2,3-diacylglucosamine diphosphatase [Pseudomonadota bacterium]